MHGQLKSTCKQLRYSGVRTRLRHLPSVPMAVASSTKSPDTLAPSELPTTYQRLVAGKTGSSFRDVAVAKTMPMEQPGPGEVLVRVHYAGINGGCETFRARGQYAFAGNAGKQDFPLGAEGCGLVAAVGPGVTSLKVGDAIACNSLAAFSEYGTTTAALCTPIPSPSPEAVAVTLSAVTACAALEGTAQMKAGETVLVTAAAGGTGHFAVQLAKLAGCRVIAVCGSRVKAERLQELGVERVIVYREEDVSSVLAAEFPAGVDVVYEGVGGALRAAILPHLAPGARLLQVGYISEYPHTQSQGVSAGPDGVPLDQLFWKGVNTEWQGRKIYGQVWPKDMRKIRECKRKVFQLHQAGQLQAWVDTSHGFKGVEQVPDAIDYMLRGGHVGKVVIPILAST